MESRPLVQLQTMRVEAHRHPPHPHHRHHRHHRHPHHRHHRHPHHPCMRMIEILR